MGANRVQGDTMARVLVLDDDLAIAINVAKLVEYYKHEAIMETNSIEAVAKWAREGLACAIIDHNMPFMDGVDVLTVFADSSPQTRRIMLTASPTQKEVQDALRAGVIQRVMSKPAMLHDMELVLAWL